MYRLVVFISFLISGCASLPLPTVLNKHEYAFTKLWGQKILCASAIRSPCGLTLSNCTTGSRYECTNEVEIVGMDELDRRARAYKAQQDRDAI